MSTPAASDWWVLRALLTEVYRPDGVAIWLSARHRRFDELTVDEMADAGRFDEVLQVAEQLATGAFG